MSAQRDFSSVTMDLQSVPTEDAMVFLTAHMVRTRKHVLVSVYTDVIAMSN